MQGNFNGVVQSGSYEQPAESHRIVQGSDPILVTVNKRPGIEFRASNEG